MRLSHSDAFYTGSVLWVFMRVVRDLIRQNKIRAEEFELRFINGLPDENMLRDLNMEKIVHHAGYFHTEQAILNRLRNSTGLLFIQRTEGLAIIPERFFKLLNLKRPLLVLTANRENYRRLLGWEGLYLANFRDETSIADSLLRMVDDWQCLRDQRGRVFVLNMQDVELRSRNSAAET
ncbi:MAG: hypothetical protein ACE5IR_26885 [bacterium]